MVLGKKFYGRGKEEWYGKLYAGTVRHLLCNISEYERKSMLNYFQRATSPGQRLILSILSFVPIYFSHTG